MSTRHGERRGGPVRAVAGDSPNPEPRYAIAAVAARTGVHVTTIRRYEEAGVVEAVTVQSGTRLYSEADIDRIWRARRLIDDLGVNLAGAAAILHLREQLITLQREFQLLQDRTRRS
jgi:DNA-binding transcriptional MerR regulator